MGITKLIIPNDYKSPLNLMETEVAIKVLKDKFEKRIVTQVKSDTRICPVICQKGKRLE